MSAIGGEIGQKTVPNAGSPHHHFQNKRNSIFQIYYDHILHTDWTKIKLYNKTHIETQEKQEDKSMNNE